MSLRLPRWIALVLLPVVVGALLLMHGLESSAAPPSSGARAVEAHSSVHQDHASTPSSDRDHGCGACTPHVMAACVAVVTSLVLLRSSRRLIGPRWIARATRGRSRWATAIGDVARPPDPVWVRLAVMTC